MLSLRCHGTFGTASLASAVAPLRLQYPRSIADPRRGNAHSAPAYGTPAFQSARPRAECFTSARVPQSPSRGVLHHTVAVSIGISLPARWQSLQVWALASLVPHHSNSNINYPCRALQRVPPPLIKSLQRCPRSRVAVVTLPPSPAFDNVSVVAGTCTRGDNGSARTSAVLSTPACRQHRHQQQCHVSPSTNTQARSTTTLITSSAPARTLAALSLH
jgi:hypothetical protein